LRGRSWIVVTSLFVLVFACLPSPAHATFPGQNGKIAYQDGLDVWVANPNGTNRTQLTSTPNHREFAPTWSPDGSRLAFGKATGLNPIEPPDVYVMNADGSSPTRLTAGTVPSWSPDGQKIVFSWGACDETGEVCDPDNLYTINVDGTNRTRLTNGPFSDLGPKWSPDGQRILFVRDGDLYSIKLDGTGLTPLTSTGESDLQAEWSPSGDRIAFTRRLNGPSFPCSICGFEIYVIKADGSSPTRLTTNTLWDAQPKWSPDGQHIAFGRTTCDATNSCDPVDMYTMNPDGTGQTFAASALAPDDWQPLPVPYPRPKGATPVRVTLVPAYPFCASPNRTHGPPLAFGSCNPPAQESGQLTVGTGDANGAPTNMTGFVRYETIVGDPSPQADEADLGLRVEITDVRVKGSLADYAGEVEAQAQTRMTDHEGAITATAADVRFPLTTQCSPTADTTIGSTCSLTTTLDTLIPGAVVERARTMLQLGQVRVVDGGTDGDTATEPNTVFLRQGLFIP
jgi:Tol biopolymer transport system component